MDEPVNTAAQSFDALHRDSARDLYAYVRTLLGDDASAEDVTALAFERAYRRRWSFDERRHATPSGRHEAEKGLPCASVTS